MFSFSSWVSSILYSLLANVYRRLWSSSVTEVALSAKGQLPMSQDAMEFVIMFALFVLMAVTACSFLILVLSLSRQVKSKNSNIDQLIALKTKLMEDLSTLKKAHVLEHKRMLELKKRIFTENITITELREMIVDAEHIRILKKLIDHDMDHVKMMDNATAAIENANKTLARLQHILNDDTAATNPIPQVENTEVANADADNANDLAQSSNQ